jgi:hypothetical protein
MTSELHAQTSTFWNFRRPSTRRSLVFSGAGAIIGLFVAGLGLFSAQGTRTFVVPPEDAAMVNNVPILMVDFVGQLRSLYNVSLSQASPAQKRKVLDDMIREELYVQRGVELGLPNDDIDVRQALVGATEATVAQDALTSRPAETELRTWYDAHQDTYSSQGVMTLQEFVLPTRQAAAAAQKIAALRTGASPTSQSLKSSGRVDDGSEFYFAARIHLGDRLFAIARGLHDDQVSEPIAMPDGVHILVMRHNQPPLPTRYEDVKDRVLKDFLDAKVARLQIENAAFLRRRADIKIASELK